MYGTTDQQGRRARAVVCAASAIDSRCASKLGDHHHRGVLPDITQALRQAAQTLVEHAQALCQSTLCAALVGMGVPTAGIKDCNARPILARQKPRCGLHGLLQLRAGIGTGSHGAADHVFGRQRIGQASG